MKRKYVFLAACLIIAFLLWHFRPQQKNQQALSKDSAQTNETQSEKGAAQVKKPRPQFTTNRSSPEEIRSTIQARIREMEIANERANDEWRTPIEFYGKAVDENNSPVEGVKIEFSCTDLSSAGNSYYRTTSDASGLFSLKNVQGKLLVVRISKEGYYTSKKENNSFNYVGENVNFVPDSNNPIVFHLRKKGQAEPLIGLDKDFQISISGKPLEIDLKTGQVTKPGQGNLILEFFRTPLDQTKERIYDWSFKTTVPGGGLVLSTKEFDFLAPEGGYESPENIEMAASLKDGWQGRIKRKYFMKLPDGNYGRIFFDLMSHNGSLKIQSFINPSGSRNLEYDEAVQPK